MPSAASFYLPLGFGFYCHQWARSAAPEKLSLLGKRAARVKAISSADEWQELSSVYDAYTGNRNGYALRDEASWRRHIEAALLEGYGALVYDGAGPCGYLFYTISDRKLVASEMAFSSETGRRGLYAFLAAHQGSVRECLWYEPLDDTSYRTWPDGAEHCYIENRTLPFMLGRIVDPVAAFDGLSCDSRLRAALAFRLTDAFLPENSGIYVLCAEGGCIHARKEDISGAALREHSPQPSFTLSASALAEWFFARRIFPSFLHWIASAGLTAQRETLWSALRMPCCRSRKTGSMSGTKG